MNYPVYPLNIIIVVILLVLVLVLAVLVSNKKKEGTQISPNRSSPMDDPNIIKRFSRTREQWYKIASDEKFRELANNLADVNSEIVNTSMGNRNLLTAYDTLEKYVKKMKMDKDIRITLIYTDGIVYYDSALPLSRVYFLQNGLPRPVSMATLASPLKNHNVVPEMSNAVAVHNTNTPIFLLGYQLNDPLYAKLMSEGFGFFERISSSLNIPYSYMAKFMPLPSGNGHNTFFLDGVILRIGIPIFDNFFKK